MKSAIETNREEIWNFFKIKLSPLIQSGASVEEVAKVAKELDLKYYIVVKAYDDTIRVSMNLKSNGIIYFMADTKMGKTDYRFNEPSYIWRN